MAWAIEENFDLYVRRCGVDVGVLIGLLIL